MDNVPSPTCHQVRSLKTLSKKSTQISELQMVYSRNRVANQNHTNTLETGKECTEIEKREITKVQ